MDLNQKKTRFVVLITGRMGSGKSQVLDFMKSKGLVVCKADQWSRDLWKSTTPCFENLLEILGDSFLNSKGEFDRKILSDFLFKNPATLKAVEQIIHPLVQKKFQKFIEDQKSQSIIFYEVPLLSKKALEGRFDAIVLVQSDKELNLKRLEKKGWKKEDIFLRWQAQEEEKNILELVDFFILNNKDLPFLEQQAEQILSKIYKEIQKK